MRGVLKVFWMAAILALNACGGGGSGEAVVTNTAPVAAASAAQNVTVASTVTLDGSASSDAESDPLTYSWTLTSVPAGSTASLDAANSAAPHFVADLAGTYVATLVVNDGKLNSTPVTVTVTATPQNTNAAPVANAGTAQSVVVGTVVTLNGSASSDANGDVLSYAWTLTTQPAGSSAALSAATSVAPTFTADVAGTYVASLVVNDGQVSSAAKTVSITASTANAAPVANAGTAQSVLVGSVVTLDGAGSSDANNDALTYAWTLANKPAGSTAALTGATTVAPTFTADVAGTYVASLVVNDGQVNSAAAAVSVTASVANAPPVANAGAAQSVVAGTFIRLSGAASSDANGDSLTYAWALTAKPTGSTATLSGATSAAPTFIADIAGTYVASLVVNDGKVNSNTATVSIIATDANAAPVANAGTLQNVLAGATVTLDGSGSSDANGDSLTYAWTLAAKPIGSAATLTAATSPTPTFTADLAGTYVASLVVNDGQVNSTAATVTITASTGNAAPVANAGTSQNVVTGAVVTLSGANSSDANGDSLTYAWTLLSKPAGSTATLAGATSVSPSFTADQAGTYVASLVVNDGKVNSAAVTVSVIATAPDTGLAAEVLVTTAAFGDVEFDWARDGVNCPSCNFGAGNSRLNWVDHNYRLWVANVDFDTGVITPADGKGTLVDTNVAYWTDFGNGPEWAFSALGSQLVYTRYTDQFTPKNEADAGIGFAEMTGPNTWSAGFLDTPPVLNRTLPAPTQTVTDSVASIAYAGAGLDFYFRQVGVPSTETLAPFGTLGLSIRWLPGTTQFVYVTGVHNPNGIDYQQVFFYDTATPDVLPVQLTSDPTQKRGAFMFPAPELGGEMVFFTVSNRTTLNIYRATTNSDGTKSWYVFNSITSPNAAEPYLASPEPFFLNGHTWIFTIVSSSSSASDVTIPTDLALTGIDPAHPSMRMLTDQTQTSPVRLRQDPEYFITSKGPVIYFSRALPGTSTTGPVHEGYYHVDTGLGPPVH